jgi:hypothetical protein
VAKRLRPALAFPSKRLARKIKTEGTTSLDTNSPFFGPLPLEEGGLVFWLTAPTNDALALPRLHTDGALKMVARR